MNLRSRTHLSFFINFLFAYSGVSINIYLPALPYLTTVFSTSTANLKLSISLFLIGFSLSQLFWGPISERYGRKPPLFLGLFITCIGVIIAMLAPTIFIFNLGRFIEAIGVGCAPVLGRSVLIDYLDRHSLAETLSTSTICTNITPSLAPIIGGYLFIWFGWRSMFLLLLIYGLINLLALYYIIPETHQKIQRDLRLSHVWEHYRIVFKNRHFWGYLFPYMLISGGLLGYYAATPFIFIEALHIAPNIYGYLSITTVSTYILGALISRALTRRVGIDQLLKSGLLLILFPSFLMIFLATFSSLSTITILVPMVFYTFFAGIMTPCSNAGAMHAVSHVAGAGNAIVGASVYGASSLLALILVNSNLNSLFSLATYSLIVSLIALGSYGSLIWWPNRMSK